MRLEEGVASEELHYDASYAPDVAREAPAKLQNDLWCSIMSCRHDRRVIFIVESGRPKINEPNFTVKQYATLPSRPRRSQRRRRYVPVISEGLIQTIHKKDILGLQVGMDEVEVMEEGDTREELAGEALYLSAWEGHETVALQEVEHTLA